jgi:AmmeMemoRadiSam system protein B
MITEFKKIRRPAVSGMFYPNSPDELRNLIREFIAGVKIKIDRSPKALIAPHAGYQYSGPVAASAFASLKAQADSIKNIIIIGPSHRMPFDGIAAPECDGFETPLGVVPVNQSLIQKALRLPCVKASDLAHSDEHCLEVELPFLQEILPQFTIAPFTVGDASDQDVADLLELLWDGDDTRIVVSSDLSHYLNYSSAKQIDEITANSILNLDHESIDYDQACGCIPVRGLIIAAKKHNLKAELIDLRNSGDTSGNKGKVVGYGAFLFK